MKKQDNKRKKEKRDNCGDNEKEDNKRKKKSLITLVIMKKNS